MDLYSKSSELASKNLTKIYSTSFSSAINQLSSEIKQDIFNIYGMVRVADEIVDNPDVKNKKKLLNKI